MATNCVYYCTLKQMYLDVESVLKVCDATLLRLTWDGGAWWEWQWDPSSGDLTCHPYMGSACLMSTMVGPLPLKKLLEMASMADTELSFRFEGSHHAPRITEIGDMFAMVRVMEYPDWSRMVTDLEKAGLLTTGISTNVLCTDQRTFTLTDRPEGPTAGTEGARGAKRSEGESKYVGKRYEVDILGTKFFTELSDVISKLWCTHSDKDQ